MTNCICDQINECGCGNSAVGDISDDEFLCNDCKADFCYLEGQAVWLSQESMIRLRKYLQEEH